MHPKTLNTGKSRVFDIGVFHCYGLARKQVLSCSEAMAKYIKTHTKIGPERVHKIGPDHFFEPFWGQMFTGGNNLLVPSGAMVFTVYTYSIWHTHSRPKTFI